MVGVANRVSIVGYAVPGPVVAMGVVLALVGLDDLLERVGPRLPGFAATGSFIALAYAYAIRFLAPGIDAVESGLAQVPDEVTASARSLGAPRAVLRPDPPAARRTACWPPPVLVGVDALKELPIAYLLRPVGFDTLPVWVYDLASESRFEQAALPALTIIAVALVPVAILSRHLDHRRRSIGDDRDDERSGPRAVRVRKAFGGLVAVDGVDLDVADHELVALVGPSGCGSRRCCAWSPGWPTSTAARSASAATSSTTACGGRSRGPPHRPRVPGARPVPAPDRRRQHRVRAA